MSLLVLGLVLFLGMHSVSVFAEGFRDRMAKKSELGWKAVYGLISIAGVVLIVKGYAAARLDPVLLYTPPGGLKHVAALLLLPTFVLFFAPYFPGRIKAATKHPQLIAVMLWAGAHLMVNGTLADVVLFGSFLVWAVVDRLSMRWRASRPVPSAPATNFNDLLLVIVGIGTYLLFTLWLHRAWFGVAPFG